MAILPDLPNVGLDVVATRSGDGEGFLTLKRYDLVVVDGEERSRPFPYDTIARSALDAAIMVAHYLDASGKPHVYLRSALRPPAALRSAFSAAPAAGVLWEVPAGLIEPGESPAAAAARELAEELGFEVGADAMQPLGPSAFPAPALIGELHFYFHVRVDPTKRGKPGGDGTPLEESGRIIDVSLERALEGCRTGEIADAKSELALRRLAEIL